MPTAIANQLIFVLAAVLAAEVWNNFGYFQDWKKNGKDPNWQGFDKKAFKHDLLIGLGLGIGAVVYQAMTANTNIGFAIPDYTSLAVFIASAAALIGPIVAVDKVFVGGLLQIESSSVPWVPAPITPAPATETTPAAVTPTPAASTAKVLSVGDEILTKEQ